MGCLSDLVWEMDAPDYGLLVHNKPIRFTTVRYHIYNVHQS